MTIKKSPAERDQGGCSYVGLVVRKKFKRRLLALLFLSFLTPVTSIARTNARSATLRAQRLIDRCYLGLAWILEV